MIEILGISCFAILFTEAVVRLKWMLATQFNFLVKERNKSGYVIQVHNLKPLDCEQCMSWWFGVTYFGIKLNPLVNFGMEIFYPIGLGAICGITAIIINQLIVKLR